VLGQLGKKPNVAPHRLFQRILEVWDTNPKRPARRTLSPRCQFRLVSGLFICKYYAKSQLVGFQTDPVRSRAGDDALKGDYS
jgi:hypothetical protein